VRFCRQWERGHRGYGVSVDNQRVEPDGKPVERIPHLHLAVRACGDRDRNGRQLGAANCFHPIGWVALFSGAGEFPAGWRTIGGSKIRTAGHTVSDDATRLAVGVRRTPCATRAWGACRAKLNRGTAAPASGLATVYRGEGPDPHRHTGAAEQRHRPVVEMGQAKTSPNTACVGELVDRVLL